jgi:hypothetical protein
LAGVVSGYEQKRLTDLVLPKVKMTDIGILKVQCYKDRSKEDLADWIISMFLVYLIGWCIGLGLNR